MKTESGEDIIPRKALGAQGVRSSSELTQLYLPEVGMYKVSPDNLSLWDYYSMKDYYQIKTAFSMIAFTLMSINWWVEGGSAKARKALTWQLQIIWTDLMRTITKAFWAGYSPNVKLFDTHPTQGYLYIKELRDLSPFNCVVSIDRKDQSFNGFIQKGGTFDVTKIVGGNVVTTPETVAPEYVEPKYAFWYTFMQENGDFTGQKLLKGAYMPWFFSQVIHLYINRYFYRFSTPLAKGFAPAGFSKNSETGEAVSNQDAMLGILQAIRNNSSVTLPSERDENGNLLWNIEYLESQMRGYDFESYLKRLDREMARALFVPDLLFEAGRVGSYKLGELHKDTYLMLLNALMNDLKQHIDKYISRQFIEYNFGANEEVPVFRFEKQGTFSTPVIMEMIKQMANNGSIGVDVKDIAKITGVPLKEAEKVMGEDKAQAEKKEEVKEEETKESASISTIDLMEELKGELDKQKEELGKNVETKMETMADKFKSEMDKVLAEVTLDENYERKQKAKEFYDNIMYVVSNQVSRAVDWVANKDKEQWKEFKLPYRSKLEKIWKQYVGGDTSEIYESASIIAQEVLGGIQGVQELKKELWEKMSDYYLNLGIETNPALAVAGTIKIEVGVNAEDTPRERMEEDRAQMAEVFALYSDVKTNTVDPSVYNAMYNLWVSEGKDKNLFNEYFGTYIDPAKAEEYFSLKENGK